MWDICMMAWRIGEILDIDRQIEWIRDAGFDGVGFNVSAGMPGHWQGVAPDATDKQARARLRNRISVFSMCEIHAPFSSELTADSLLTATEELIPILDFAGDIGASIVTVHAKPPASTSETLFSSWRNAMERLNAKAAQNGVAIGLEVTAGFEWIAQLRLSNIGVTLDVGHMYHGGGRPLQPFGTIGELIHRLGSSLVHLHLHDYNDGQDHIELGTGQVDFDGILTALNEIGYEKGLCLELNPDSVSPHYCPNV